jgi:activator of HSP90 ATPase
MVFFHLLNSFYMSKNIVQKVVFKKTAPKALYDLYMNAKKHSVATGAPAKITNKVGDKFSVHGGYITGENLQLVKDELIVQTWRTMEWDKKEPDSIFIIHLERKGKDTVVHAIHAGLPDKHTDSINKGWHVHYWDPWKKFLAGTPIAKSPEM